jgi:uncharacterized protein (DUF427 family)
MPFRRNFKEMVMANPAPGFAQYPKHRVVTRPAGIRVLVKFEGDVIADTSDAIALEETMEGSTLAPVVYYIPRKDVRMERLVRTSHHTYCPFKGQASYYSIGNGPDNAVWSYEAPYDEMLVLKELLAFYPDKVEIAA